MVKVNENQPVISSRFRVNIFWVGKAPLVKNKNYKLKIGTMRIGVKLVEILNIIDAAELNIDSFKNQVERHDVAECIFETSKPIAFDPISDIELTGRFVIVDNYEISGGGIILEGVSDSNNTLMEQIRDREYLWEKGLITSKNREEIYGHKSKFVVITTGSEENEEVIRDIGKYLENRLFKMNYKSYYLGVSSLLHGLASDSVSGFEAREAQIRQIGELARIFTDAGQIFITSIFNLDDYEADKLKLLNQPHDIIIVNIGESPFSSFKPDANINIEGAVKQTVDSVFDLLKKKEIILDYYI